jgi:hypothetical protein
MGLHGLLQGYFYTFTLKQEIKFVAILNDNVSLTILIEKQIQEQVINFNYLG